MKIKNFVHAGVPCKLVPTEKWDRIVELIEHNNALIRELQEEIK